MIFERIAAAHQLPLTLERGVVAVPEYCKALSSWQAIDEAATERLAITAHAVPLLERIDSWQALDYWANRVADAECPFRHLRRPGSRPLLNIHAVRATAYAANAPDFAKLAAAKLDRYRAGADSSMLAQLTAFVAICTTSRG